MQSINFNEGYKTFCINGDKSRVIRFNPSDPNLIQRYEKALKNIKEAQGKIGTDIKLNSAGEPEQGSPESAAEILVEVDNIIRENVNFMFNSDVYDTVFAGQSPFCFVGGKFLFEAFLMSVKPFLEESARKAASASEKRMNQYLKGYRK